MKTRVFLSLLTTIIFILTLVVFASAARIDFSTSDSATNQGGTISYAGAGVSGDAPLIGTNIVIGAVRGIETPAHAGEAAAAVTGLLGGFGDMDFSTGTFISYTGGTYSFGSGGFLTIVGEVSVAGTGQTTLVDAPVISATFSTAGLAIVIGADTKDPELLAYFGFAADTPFTIAEGTVHTGALTAYGGGAYVPGGSFTAPDGLSADIPNEAVPEPATMLLLGSGLIGLAGYARRRFRK